MKLDKIKLIVAMTIFGTIGLLRRALPYPSGMIALVRAFIGALFLYGFRLLRGGSPRFQISKKNLLLLALSGLMLGANWVMLFEAYTLTTVPVATVCNSMAPFIVILLSPWICKEKLTLKKGICTAMAVVGAVLVSGVFESGVSGMGGAALALISAFSYAAIIFLNKKTPGVDADDRAILQLGFAALCILPYVLFTTDFASLDFSLSPVLLLLLGGVLHTGIAYAFYFNSIHRLPVQTAGILSYTDSVVAVVLSAIFLNEGLNLLSGSGALLVLGGALLMELPLFEKKNSAVQ